MGKIRRERTRLHFAAAKGKASESRQPEFSLPQPQDVAVEENVAEADPKRLGIVETELLQEEAINDARTKKGKRKARKEKFLNKLNIAHQLKVKENEAKRRAKTAVVGDMQPLLDALPDIKSLFEASLVKAKNKKRNAGASDSKRGTPKTGKARMNANLEDIMMFQKVSEDSRFRANPAATILQHLKYLDGSPS